MKTIKAKYTPGPWRIEKEAVSGAFWISGAFHDVCDLYSRVNGKCEKYPNADGDAALIAAAPDLLEACRMALASLKEADRIGVFQSLVSTSTLERAISMAEGVA